MRKWVGVMTMAVAATVVKAPVAEAEETQLPLVEPDVEPDVGSDPLIDALELSLDLGVMDRGTTGVGEPLLGLGYDHGGGALAGVGARAYLEIDRYFAHGLSLRLSHQAGSLLGLDDGVGFAWSQLDVTYVFRTLLPCMSDDEVRFYLSGLVGVTGVRADAGTGTAPRDDRWNERQVASRRLDHDALGPMLGASLDVHFGAFFVGALIDVREPFALGAGPVSRSFVTTGSLRTGVQLAL